MRTATTEAPSRRYWFGFAALAAVIIPATVLVRPGRVVDDGRTDLLVDPGGALLRGLRVWDPDRALGTVAAGDVRRLWPLTTYHWLMDAARVPDWVAQRLWIAGLLLAAAGGVLAVSHAWRWRPSAAVAAAVAYALSPIVATGVLDAQALLPWAGLPWILALTIQALRHRGWRHPVAFAVVLAAAGSGDAMAAALLVGISLAWIAHARWLSRETTRTRAISTVAKLGLAAGILNAWWVVALTVQATNGVDAARYGVPSESIAGTSSAAEVVRGLGRWTAYRSDVAEITDLYTQQPLVLLVSFLVPALGLLALGVSRWRYRAFAIGLVVGGTVLAAAAYDRGPASPLRALLDVVDGTGPGSAVRGLETAVIAVALGLSLGVGALVAASGEQSVRRGVGAAAAIAVVAVVALPALWEGGIVPDGASREGTIDADTRALAAHLDDGGSDSRVLELPGQAGVRHDGSTDLQAVLERPHASRHPRPTGSAAGTDLLRALDDRVQQGTLAPEALAPLARLLGAGDVVVRAGGSPGAAELLRAAPGFGPVREFGDLLTAPVSDPVDIVRTSASTDVVLLSGSGDGIVDAAAAGLLEGDELIRYSSSVTDDPEFIRDQLVDRRRLIITDSNRVRAQRWTGLAGVLGFTEAPDGGLLAPDPFDQRLGFRSDRVEARTVAEPGPVTVQATSYGPDDRYRPDQRPALAVDGDESTAWLVPAERAVGEELRLTADVPVEPNAVRILQRPGSDGTAIDEVVLHFDGDEREVVALTEASRTAPGQRIEIGERRVRTLGVVVRTLTGEPAEGVDVGLAEVDVSGLRAGGWVRMPTDLLDAAGYRTTRYPLSLVQTRLRSVDGAADEEPALQRIVDLPTSRTYRLTGRARALEGQVGAGCRDDIVTVDARPVPVRLVPASAGAHRIEGCDPEGVPIAGGAHRFATAPGTTTGVDVDQLVWTSDPGASVTGPRIGTTAPALRVTSSDATTVSVAMPATRPGAPFWIVLGQSHDGGWQGHEVEEGTEVDGPHLVNGYANGFLVTPGGDRLDLELRFLPQNRVEVALLFSALGALVAGALALLRPQPLGAAPSHRQEPLRRLRALSYEGALPTKREAMGIAAIGGSVGTLVGGVAVGLVLAALGGYATRREGWRPTFTLLPAALVAGTAVALVLAQVEDRIPHTLDWPAQWWWAHTLTLTALLLLGLDVLIDHVWRRGSLLE